ncbi:hypothetical protein SPONN_1590 [uncultured Candidatus Thioglobus sp.]|nr:hypothetical protein SPONN_1590 [uncultured Candidatus Thioglobus sp.]
MSADLFNGERFTAAVSVADLLGYDVSVQLWFGLFVMI